MQRKTKLDLSDALATWQLGELLPLPPAQLSSGQRQRAFLAIQLYLPAQVLLMDEPERYLDTHWQQCLTTELRNLASAGGSWWWQHTAPTCWPPATIASWWGTMGKLIDALYYLAGHRHHRRLRGAGA